MGNNNVEKEEVNASLPNVKTWLESFEMSVWMSCVMLLLAIVLAVLPGFGILAYAQSLLLDTPISDSFILWSIYAVKAVVVCISTVMATVCYADMVFPAVMETFVLILNRTALPDSIHHQLSGDVSGSGNISGISATSVGEE